jgi:hypothetical protein
MFEPENKEVEKPEVVDVLDTKGDALPKSSLSSIFDKIEAGKEEGQTTAEIISESKAE